MYVYIVGRDAYQCGLHSCCIFLGCVLLSDARFLGLGCRSETASTPVNFGSFELDRKRGGGGVGGAVQVWQDGIEKKQFLFMICYKCSANLLHSIDYPLNNDMQVRLWNGESKAAHEGIYGENSNQGIRLAKCQSCDSGP